MIPRAECHQETLLPRLRLYVCSGQQDKTMPLALLTLDQWLEYSRFHNMGAMLLDRLEIIAPCLVGLGSRHGLKEGFQNLASSRYWQHMQMVSGQNNRSRGTMQMYPMLKVTFFGPGPTRPLSTRAHGSPALPVHIGPGACGPTSQTGLYEQNIFFHYSNSVLIQN